MKSAELTQGRAFVLRLEDGDVLHECIESFCRENKILRAHLTFTGAAEKGSLMVSGPRTPIEGKVSPFTLELPDKCEITGAGTVFPDADGNPIAHLHGSAGREGFSATGDFRRMVAWLVIEVAIVELIGEGPVRLESDPRLDGKLLEIRRWPPRRS